ncbi:MAG: DUF356 domain-containing protein [Candidatus Methanoperedens sp.]|nr:DUF356 domain-containing protein [Candidatus Methanoperedens sp.]MCE8424786.1 DUF356 domain-containing protein [Candidatus Methanoperedens sp.]MCE8427080.1 DUF356 domain-containing protein [Candidatus Methanoperedens sp.]
MNSLAIVRATDILKLKTTLNEMKQAGLLFEGHPKEINPGSIEKALSNDSGISNSIYEVCALVPINQDFQSFQDKIEAISRHSNVKILDPTHSLYNNLANMIPILPDLVIPNMAFQEQSKQTNFKKNRPSSVYLGVFVNRQVKVETGSGVIYEGVLKHADSIGALLEPVDDSSPLFITWHDIKKIIIPKEKKK